MLTTSVASPAAVTDFSYLRLQFDLAQGAEIAREQLQVGDDMEFLGGIGRSFKVLAEYDVRDPFAPDSPLVINTGCLTGTAFMTGLRTYFSGYSPLKRTRAGMPMAAWSAMSGSFGRKLVSTGIGDLILTGAADTPQILEIRQTDDGPGLTLRSAPAELIGARVPEKMTWLGAEYNDREHRNYPAHFAVLGPAGEHWQTNWYACIVGTTQEYVMSGEDKYRFAGRLGMGSILGSKNIIAIVVHAEKDHYRKGDDALKDINREIGRGDQSRGFRHPDNNDGLGGTGKNARLLDEFGLVPFKNFEPRDTNVAEPVHIETMRESDEFIVVDKNCFGCQISCHMDFYDVPAEGKDRDSRKARRNHGKYLGRYEYEPMELSGPNLGILDPHENLAIARLGDDLGFDVISVYVVLAYLMDRNERGGEPVANGIRFGDATAAMQVMEDIAYGREPLFGKGVKAISEEIGGVEYAMHSKGVEHSAYLGQTNPGYPFAIAGGHMSMRTFLLFATDPKCEPDSADYWVDQIMNEGWKSVAKDLHGGCLFGLFPPNQVASGVESLFGVPMSGDRILDATYRAHVLGFALEQKQGATLAEYTMPDEVLADGRKGDLPGVHFLTRELFDEIRERVFALLREDAQKLGYGVHLNGA